MATLIMWVPSSLASLHVTALMLQLVVPGKPVPSCALLQWHSSPGTSRVSCLGLTAAQPLVGNCSAVPDSSFLL